MEKVGRTFFSAMRFTPSLLNSKLTLPHLREDEKSRTWANPGKSGLMHKANGKNLAFLLDVLAHKHPKLEQTALFLYHSGQVVLDNHFQIAGAR